MSGTRLTLNQLESHPSCTAIEDFRYDDVPLALIIALEPALNRITIITGEDA